MRPLTPKKILTVVYSLGIGGTERAAQNFAFGYSDNGHDSRLLVTAHDGPRRKNLEEKNVLVYNINDAHCRNELEQWGPDIVHIHSHGLDIEIFNILKRMFAGSKFVETNVFSIPSLWNDQIDVSFQLSSWCSWRYSSHPQYKGENIAVVPNPIVCNDFIQSNFERDINRKSVKAIYGIPESAFVLGRIGQANIANWSVWIIDIFENLHNEGFTPYLLLVSPPNEVLERVFNSKYRHYVIVVDPLFDDLRLKKYYSAIDLFLHIASIGESFGYVNAESILCGTPVLTMATPWYGNSQIEVVDNEICGFVFHRKTTAKELIKRIILGEIDYDVEKGISSIRSRFDYINVCNDVLNIVYKKEHLCSSPMPPRDMMLRSYDHPKYLVLLCLRINYPVLTRFASGYESWSHLPLRFLKKIFRLLLVRK